MSGRSTQAQDPVALGVTGSCHVRSSAVPDAGTADPVTAINWYQTAFAAATYRSVASDGPREDGSYELIGGSGTCDIRITATPLGGSTIITVMYRARCPFN